MKRYVVVGYILACFTACKTVENTPIESVPSVEDRLAGPITLTFSSEEGMSVVAISSLSTSSRPLAMRVTMPNTGEGALPPETLARLRTEKQIQVTVESGLDKWAVRGDTNATEMIDLQQFIDYFDNAETFLTLCGSDIAKARFTLSDGTHSFKSRITVLDPFRPFGLYPDSQSACKENDWFTANGCTRLNPDIACSAVIDCGTALGGTRRCSGDCRIVTGVFDDVCHCDINESLCCSQTLPPVTQPPRPVTTEAATRFEN